jgi:hypothetical protein
MGKTISSLLTELTPHQLQNENIDNEKENSDFFNSVKSSSFPQSLKEMKSGELLDELHAALNMPVDPNCQKVAFPMQHGS